MPPSIFARMFLPYVSCGLFFFYWSKAQTRPVGCKRKRDRGNSLTACQQIKAKPFQRQMAIELAGRKRGSLCTAFQNHQFLFPVTSISTVERLRNGRANAEPAHNSVNCPPRTDENQVTAYAGAVLMSFNTPAMAVRKCRQAGLKGLQTCNASSGKPS